MKRKIKKIFLKVTSNTKIFLYKILFNEIANDQDFAKLTGGLDKGGRTGQRRIRYNDRLHSTTNVAPFKAMKNASDKELMEKIRKNTQKRRLKAKTVSETYPDGSISESIITLNNWQRACPFSSSGLQKSFINEKWIVIGKVIYSRRD